MKDKSVIVHVSCSMFRILNWPKHLRCFLEHKKNYFCNLHQRQKALRAITIMDEL